MAEDLSSCKALSPAQKYLLKRGNITTASDLVFTPIADIARKCRVSPLEIKGILDTFYRSRPIQPQTLTQCFEASQQGVCTSGDQFLDDALGGGLRSKMIWEVVGESAAGKTQLALQLSLLVQLPEEEKGLSGSSCYMVTSAQLPTERLLQISENHPLLGPSYGLDNVHTMATPTIPALINALEHTLPRFIEEKQRQYRHDSTTKEVRLVVIDALGELFHTSDKTSTSTLVERSRNITEISHHLHTLANVYNLIILVLNEVIDAFERDPGPEGIQNLGLPYAEQSRWFSRPPSEFRKEASLGLVWANQVNTRIMLSRTGRRRYVDDGVLKRRRLLQNFASHSRAASSNDDNLTLIRRLSVIFSSVSAPVSLDYIVTTSGIWILPNSDPALETAITLPQPIAPDLPGATQLVPLDIGAVEESNAVNVPSSNKVDDEEWDEFWNSDEFTAEMYYSVES
ncbi:rad51b protein [Moniliophthora roreri MCA 2997]|uniref:Rad51b protein n=2 Tax=Moniliophthora roreri TaxID=221103 RepID=V2WWC2_MONRO|nr:rad51b protein [Moniliophthora roreri MCA 2997]KAI3610780.1 rad51b protein [Moniliophthora roreri]